MTAWRGSYFTVLPVFNYDVTKQNLDNICSSLVKAFVLKVMFLQKAFDRSSDTATFGVKN